MKKILIPLRIALFAALAACALFGLSRLTILKESEEKLRPYLDAAGQHDVLFLGDSQVTYGLSPLEIYKKYGISCYNLATVNSTLPMSYWTLRCALDYAVPRVAVISVKDIQMPGRLPDAFERVHTALDGFPLNATKARAILDLTSGVPQSPDGLTPAEMRLELLFPLAKYHSRWSKLTSGDLHPEYNRAKGEVMRRFGAVDPYEYELLDPDDCAPEEGEGYRYLRKILELCRDRGIEPVVILPPHPTRAATMRAAHTAGKIAEEYGAPMLNFVDMDRVADYFCDCDDPESHLNPSGVRKVSDYLGRYLADHYSLPDHRGEEAFASWEKDVDAYIDRKLDVLAHSAEDFRSQLALLHDEDWNLVLTVRDGFEYSGEHTREALQNIARPHVFEGDDQRSYDLRPLTLLREAAREDTCYLMIVDRDWENVTEYYGYSEDEYETSFGYVFCRMNDYRMDLSLTQDDTETYYFESDEEMAADIRALVIDRRTGKVALTLSFSREE